MRSLTMAISSHLYTEAVNGAALQTEDFRLRPVEVRPQIAAFRRMVRDLEFDLCELSLPTYFAAREVGIPITALPVPLNRDFHHGSVVCRPGSGVSSPTDIEGRRVGVRAYTVTTGVWARGVLRDSYAVNLRAVTWITDDEEHVQSLQLPAYVQRAARGKSLVEMFKDGEIDAALSGNAGLGRTGSPHGDWGKGLPHQPNQAYPLIADPEAEQRAWFEATGIYPSHGVLTVKSAILDALPWLASRLFELFTAAKQPFLDMLADPSNNHPEVVRFRVLSEIVRGDPLPFGLEANRLSFETLARYCCEQDILGEMPNLNDIFVPLN